MKIVALVFIVIIHAGILFAQENKNIYTRKIDSIEKLLDIQPGNDTNKVKRLGNLAIICFRDLQYQKGFRAIIQARDLAEKLAYKKGYGMYLRAMAELNSYSDLSLYYKEKTKWFYNDINQKEDVFNVQVTYPDSAFIVKAKIQLNTASKYFEKSPEKEIIAQILYNIGQFDVWLDKPKEAILYLDKAIKLFRENKQDPAAAFVLTLKMWALQTTGKTKEANEAHAEVNRIISTTGNVKEAALLSYHISRFYYGQGKKTLAIESSLRADNELEKIGDRELRILVLQDLAVNFGFMGMSQKAVEYYKKAISLREQTGDYTDAIRIYFNTGFELVGLTKFDEAKIYFTKAKDLSAKSSDSMVRRVGVFRYADAMGQILMGEGKYQEALAIFNEADENSYVDFYKAYCYQKSGNLKQAIIYGEKSYKPIASYGDERLTTKLCLLLSEVYEQAGQPMKAYEYLKQYRAIIKDRDEQDVANHSANLEIQAVVEKSEREKDLLEKAKLLKEKQNQNQRWWLVCIAGALVSTFVVLFILYRNNQNKQRANALLQKQKEEIQATLSQLTATQSQLIQSEKMASLGELTAGIAHEIQNPLNFVNNFSEVNKELLAEMKDEISKGNIAEGMDIADDVIENEEKINHHGKRADAIVKGMLQHSRSGSSQKERTDINALVAEYLRLSYHGYRAKHKEFNATLETDFDNSAGNIDVIPQDIGRVLLNIYNNAFYALTEKKESQAATYEPTVFVSTKKLNDTIEIRINDNGSGIPQNLAGKIFQPFFTTKPTGQGTGLGLSLSYDIVKAHGGVIKVNTLNGGGTEFVIELPS